MNTPNFHNLRKNNLRIVLAYIGKIHGDNFFICELENGEWGVCNEDGLFGDVYDKETVRDKFGWAECMVEENIVFSHKIKPKQIKICTCDIVAMWNCGHAIGCVERK